MKSEIQVDYRCGCGKLLFRGLVFRSSMEVKCPRCNKLNFIEGIGSDRNPNRFSVLTTLKGKIVSISGPVESALGYKPEDLTGDNINKIFFDEQAAEVDKIFIQKIIGKKYLRLDGVCRNEKGEKIPVSICYQYFKHNGGELFLRIIDAVPEIDKKLLDDANFDFSYFCDVITETDEEGMILYAGGNLGKTTGYKPEDLVGLNAHNLIYKDEKIRRPENYKMLRVIKKAYRTMPGVKFKDKNGKPLEMEVYCTPFYDEAGNFIGFRNMHWLRKI